MLTVHLIDELKAAFKYLFNIFFKQKIQEAAIESPNALPTEPMLIHI